MKKFWNWARDETVPDARVLRLEGTIAEESWFEDDVTPAAFKGELFSDTGPVTIWINSPGGDCVAAAQIYNMLMDYQRRPSGASAGVSRTAQSAPQARNAGRLILPHGATQRMALILLTRCNELWYFGDTVSDGMKKEISRARWRNIPVRHFTEDCKEVRA